MSGRIGVDVGGTKIEAIALDSAGSECFRRRVPTPADSYDGTIASIRELVEQARQVAGADATVGVGTPGSPSPTDGIHRNANSTCLNGRPFRADLAVALATEVRMANDANCFALSEAVDGAGAGARCVFGVILGTGCGGGVSLDGRAHPGASGVAGEWGHVALPARAEDRPDDRAESRACWCGRTNCLEVFLSGPAIEAEHAARAGSRVPLAEIAVAARDGDAVAEDTLERFERRLARALSIVVNLLDPDVIVLGGGVSNLVGLADRVAALVPAGVFGGAWSGVVRHAEHGDSSGVRGAAWLWGLQ